MRFNVKWHIANTFTINAPFSQKMEWHKEHKKHCGCRLSVLEITGSIWKWQLKKKIITNI